MSSLVTRFHTLLLSVTIAITAVGFFRIPADFAFPAHWTGSTPDWLWPRDAALLAGPAIQLVLVAAFFLLGRLLTKNHLAKTRHIFEPALSLLLAIIAATQLSLLFVGIGSDLDLMRVTGAGLGVVLLPIGVVLFEAERHTYAGLRMPWPIADDGAWRLVHRLCGGAFFVSGLALLALAWFNVGVGILVMAFAGAVFVPAVLAAGTSVLLAKN
ncbi:SdpI family protein [Devosia sp.]|uniref:SdpI family protein n=1 Tax=Devosia sp. TaxID=1871048 RepID=UPI002AFF9D8B|nr:SdpI family protein [Devosia sp.]